MNLSPRIRHALPAVIELAVNYDNGLIRLQELINNKTISPKYLEQILLRLKNARLTLSFMGPKGGVILAKPPEQITLAMIIEVLDGPSESAECPEHKSFTAGCPDCVVCKLFEKYTSTFSKLLNSITLQDLADLANGTKKPDSSSNRTS